MKYFIEISLWNLMESFVTESISPFTFYHERKFGNNLSRYLSGDKERYNHLILSTKDLGGDFSICIDETLIDCTLLNAVKGSTTIFMYPKTIYYRQGFVNFRVSINALVDSLVADSQILLEVKCIEKYLSAFYVEEVEREERKSLLKLDNQFSFDMGTYVEFDNFYNKIKGAVVGYSRGFYTSSDESNIMLQNELRELKNSFGGYNTKIMMSDIYVKNEYIEHQICKCKELYFAQIGYSISFDVLVAQFQEIEKLANLKAKENQKQMSPNRNKEIEELKRKKTEIEGQLYELDIQYNIFEVKHELDKIKEKEKVNGERKGKNREYFKRGTQEYERKKQLKLIIEDFEKNNPKYRELKGCLNQIEQELREDPNKYDSTLSAIFSRVSDILNDLIKKASMVTNKDAINLSNLLIDGEVVSIENSSNSPEICYLNILLKQIIQLSNKVMLSEHAVLQLLVDSATDFKKDTLSESDKGQKMLDCLRDFWQYKNQKKDCFSLPDDDMPIFQSIFSFFVKPLEFEQIERYMLLKKFTQKAYAFMLWGAWIGFADIPKTFTKTLYSNEVLTKDIDDFLFECIRSFRC